MQKFRGMLFTFLQKENISKHFQYVWQTTYIFFFYIHVKNKPLWKCMLNILKAHHSTQRSFQRLQTYQIASHMWASSKMSISTEWPSPAAWSHNLFLLFQFFECACGRHSLSLLETVWSVPDQIQIPLSVSASQMCCRTKLRTQKNTKKQ